jgi:putative transposase
MIVYRGYKYRLYGTEEQEVLLHQFAEVCRLVYNLALEQRRDHWRQYERSTGGRLNFPAQCKELTALRAAIKWIAAVPVHVQQQALRDLDQAFTNFFMGRTAYPMPRHKGEHDAIRFQAIHCSKLRKINAKWSVIRLPKLGNVRVRTHRALEGKPLSITVVLEGGRWYVSFACEIECANPPAPSSRSVAINRGIGQTLTLSTGGVMSPNREQMKVLDRRAHKAQRMLSRRRRGSRRYGKARLAVRRLKAKAARCRKDWNHKASYNIARRFGVVVLERLKTASMTRRATGLVADPDSNFRDKNRLNRAILEQGWYQFGLFLGYKLDERGSHLVEVDPAYSLRTCSTCRHVSLDNCTTQALFACVSCGNKINADVNAARVILSCLQWADVGRGVSPASQREAKGRKALKTSSQGEAQLSHTHKGKSAKRMSDQRFVT